MAWEDSRHHAGCFELSCHSFDVVGSRNFSSSKKHFAFMVYDYVSKFRNPSVMQSQSPKSIISPFSSLCQE